MEEVELKGNGEDRAIYSALSVERRNPFSCRKAGQMKWSLGMGCYERHTISGGKKQRLKTVPGEIREKPDDSSKRGKLPEGGALLRRWTDSDFHGKRSLKNAYWKVRGP